MYKVAVVTSTRADYGLLRPVIKKIHEHPVLELQLLVTGAHLALDFGHTVDEIEGDGLPIASRLDYIDVPVAQGRLGTAQRTAAVLRLFAEYLTQPQNRPDALLLLGDRYEIMAAAEAAALLDIPVVHISGGDVTAGADDDWFRHCITKMSKLHFPSCEAYRQRVIRMGEMPGRVFNVGGLGDENARSMTLLTIEDLSQSLGVDMQRPYALVTFHPETLGELSPAQQIDAFLGAVEQNPQLFYLFTKAGADVGGEEMNAHVAEYCDAHDDAVLFSSLGALRYLSAMKHAALVLGNSSSGVVETPTFGVPTIDIGQRQAGRITGENVINCHADTEAISDAICRALSPEFAKSAAQASSPYNGGDTSGNIVRILEEHLSNGALFGAKYFYDGGAN